MRKVLGIIGLLTILVSCEKELDIHYHDVESRLVIEGHTSDAGTYVMLTRTTPMGEPMDTKPITDAEVSLVDLTDDIELELNVNDKGVFHDATPGITGHEYKINIVQNGNTYVSVCTMRPATQIVDFGFQWIKMPYDYVAVLQISFLDLESEEDCYWIKLYRNDESYMWILSDDRGTVNGIISESTMTSRKNVDEEDEKSVLKEGDEVKVVITSVSREMYDYLVAIQSDSNGSGMFNGDFCLGYYLAANDAEATIIFHPDEMDIAD